MAVVDVKYVIIYDKYVIVVVWHIVPATPTCYSQVFVTTRTTCISISQRKLRRTRNIRTMRVIIATPTTEKIRLSIRHHRAFWYLFSSIGLQMRFISSSISRRLFLASCSVNSGNWGLGGMGRTAAIIHAK
jgi:hypothetical protein